MRSYILVICVFLKNDKKNLKSKEYVDDQWQRYNDKLFANFTDIMDASKPISKSYTILHKILKTYIYSDKSHGLSPYLDLFDPVRDKKHKKKDNTTFEDKKFYLHLNRANKDFSI